ncbi:MAG: M20/M25/M40 family metallo-hydrolase [Bacteroidetes bacterium]|nr:M20/M25/M40 family metallo-hydrolase [Bacteroidota bacterium]
MIRTLLILIALLPAFTGQAQPTDSLVIRKIFNYCLEEGKSYEWLDYLSNKIGPRLSGSVGAEKAVAWAKMAMEAEGNGSVSLQEVMVPHWERGTKQELTAISGNEKKQLRICSLGGSVPTPTNGVSANVVEIRNFEELEYMGREKLEGKIIFFNVPMDQKHYHTFHAYGECGKYRYAGAARAAKFGAVGSITRSLTLSLDDYPHTGAMGYADSVPKIPACAISTKGADELSRMIKLNPETKVELTMDCQSFPDVLSYNVIAEIKGSVFPDEIIVVGGHLDAWDNGHGAHDDGAGCVQSMELLRIFRDLKIQPKRTIRVVLFMNEENGLKGALKYAEVAKAKGENHIAALESDAGGFSPRGFSSECKFPEKTAVFNKWKPLFEHYGIFEWPTDDGGGADINRLEDQGTLLIGLMPDSQRYFDYHHTEIDTFDKVNKRELHLGAASMASLVYLLSEYGVK